MNNGLKTPRRWADGLLRGEGKKAILLILLSAVLLVSAAIAGFFVIKSKSAWEAKPTPASIPTPTPKPQATLFLLPSQEGVEIRLKTSLQNVSGIALRLSHDKKAKAIQLKPNPELKTDGWQFPIKQVKDNKIDLAAVYTKPENYIFEKEILVATITFTSDSAEKISFEFDPGLTKITTKDGGGFTPNLEE